MRMQNLPNNYFTSINDFLILQQTKPLGSGSFGIVHKAWHKMTNKLYAIKIVQLDENTNQAQILLLNRQITIHSQLNHPHIIKLWSVIENNNKIYMIMDYAENGNLFNYLNKKKSFTQLESFKIFYQVLDAIQFMHKQYDVFHRDIKPQNILLDHQYNIKLCDFGWVADQINRKRTTFCGTYQYMAPQMVKDIPYNYKIDIWALGILLYELNHGKAPFPAQSVQKIKQRFQKGGYQIKQTLSQQFRKLIISILQFDPNKRYQIQDIKNSQWVKKFKNIYSQQNQLNIIRNFVPTSLGEFNRIQNGTIKIYNKDDNKIKGLLDQTQNRQKKYRKKYRTLQQQDLYGITQNINISKHGSIKDNTKFYDTFKENYMKDSLLRNVSPKDSLLRQKQNMNKNYYHQRKQSQIKKKKIGSIRTHTRTGTQTNQLLQKKLSKIVFHEKLKLFNDDKKRKPASKRN